MHISVSNQATQSECRLVRPLTCSTTPIYISTSTNRQNCHDQTYAIIRNHDRELVGDQLAEQSWVAGPPSSTTAYSMSTHSRRSSAPLLEYSGKDETIENDWNNDCDDEEENIVDWDEPDKADEGNSRHQNNKKNKK